ncbi:MAG: Glu/Leu/Phe/Val dehydrogenase [Alphaproteobacteria bacterium]|nr:Glu/Leu/Phe/Val dehydrogenase [Alphaproteobacteria bacterium]
MADVFDLADKLGPFKVLHIHRPGIGLRAIVCVDNIACGPSIGGVRMAPDVSVDEAFRLARAMTFKNAAAGLAHGGGKSVIFGDPRMPPAQKEMLIRAFAQAIAELVEYIPGPDMGTDERAMAWVKDEIGRAVGLPRVLGGIPLDEIGATGFGLFGAIDVAKDHVGMDLEGARVAIQGFGAVGMHAARHLARAGARLVAASDTHGTIADEAGLDVEALIAHKHAGRALGEFAGGRKLGGDAIVDVACEVWIPAARPDVIRADNVDRLQTRIVAQGANIPCTPAAEASLHRRGVLVLPDFIANAGGVICAAVEYHGGTEAQAMAVIDERIRANTRAVLDESKRAGSEPRAAALALAERRVRAAAALRRWA